MTPTRHPNRMLTAAIVSTLLALTTSEVAAQSSTDPDYNRPRKPQAQKAKQEQQVAQAPLYPEATRKEPETKASSKLAPKLQKMMDFYSAQKQPEARAAADEILANSAANPYERSLANEIAAQAAYSQNDSAAAKTYLNAALQTNGLDNNGHYQSMFMLSQLQVQDEQYAEALATIDKFMAETKSQKPEYLITKGNALYRLERFPEAITALKQAIDAAGPAAKPEWQQMLMASYFDNNQPAEATKIGEALLAQNPDDVRLQTNMAALYMQANQNDKAIALMEKMRAAGKLTEPAQYQNLYASYLNTDGQEKKAIAVIEEGLQKGILKDTDYQPNVALAQAYYMTDQTPQAIAAYRKAAPLGKDGEAYLNLARLLWQEQKVGEAKQAAQQALDKGLKKPEEAKKILALKSK